MQGFLYSQHSARGTGIISKHLIGVKMFGEFQSLLRLVSLFMRSVAAFLRTPNNTLSVMLLSELISLFKDLTSETKFLPVLIFFLFVVEVAKSILKHFKGKITRVICYFVTALELFI